MNLIFTANEILTRPRGLVFDDVLLMPCHSDISSRMHPDLKTNVTRNHTIDVPVISSNMDTISEKDMCCAMSRLGGVGILHRFMTIEDQINQVRAIRDYQDKNNIKAPIAVSVGVKDEGKQRADALCKEGVHIITIDIAHGDSVMMFEVLEYVKKKYPKVDVIAGNVATAEAVKRLINAGADAIKVGIGPGSMCTTRIITGCGVPQLTAVAICADAAKGSGVPVIADGGIRNSGDMVKALCAGASSIMVGSLLAGTLETPGEMHGGFKQYRGMASKAAQVSWRGELPQGMAPEGESTLVACKGSVENVIHELSGGIRSGMTYLNARNISQMRENARFMEISPQGMTESRPHGVK